YASGSPRDLHSFPTRRSSDLGTGFNCAGDAIFAPRRDPFHFVVNCLERFAAQLIDADKELFDVAEDDRRLRAPTVWIRVVESLLDRKSTRLSSSHLVISYAVF